MLRLTLAGTDGLMGALEIANEAEHGPFCDYAAVLFSADDSPVSLAMVEGYARWSAPAHDLALRALAVALCDSETNPRWERVPDARPVPGELEAALWLQPPWSSARSLGHWHLRVTASSWHLTERLDEGPAQEVELPMLDARESAWAAVGRAWCYRLTGTGAMPPRRPPVAVPIFASGRVSYVRLRDVPDHIRPTFLSRMRHATRPIVPGVPDAFYSWDLAALLGYGPEQLVEAA